VAVDFFWTTAPWAQPELFDLTDFQYHRLNSQTQCVSQLQRKQINATIIQYPIGMVYFVRFVGEVKLCESANQMEQGLDLEGFRRTPQRVSDPGKTGVADSRGIGVERTAELFAGQQHREPN
jgi:hypothetical protein